jgi:uncharacterized protein YbjT (DUF2867 family)
MRNERGRILVVGGTGVVGKPIVHQLEAAGWKVRVTSRNASRARDELGPRVELVAGDATREAELASAMEGCRAALISVSDLLDPYLDLRVTKNMLRVASDQGTERIGLISGTTVAEDRREFPMVDAKYQAEEMLRRGGIPWMIFRLSWPMESLARFVHGHRALIIGQQAGVIHPIAGDDVGRMVARAFELDDAVGRTFTIHGAGAYTMQQWLEEYCALAQPEAHVRHVPFWVLSAVATLTGKRMLKAAVALMRYLEGHAELGDPTETNRLLGAPRITLAEWVTSRAAHERAHAA